MNGMPTVNCVPVSGGARVASALEFDVANVDGDNQPLVVCTQHAPAFVGRHP
jgi:hypothetical protein